MNDVGLETVTEPHDFTNDHLIALDTALRCSICKDLLQKPVFAPCTHSFCSMCIRESLTVKPECPICRSPTNDGQLKRNTTLSEVVEAYRLARETMLTHERQVRNTVLGKRKRSDTSSSDVDMPPRNTRMKSDNSVFHAGGSRINSRGGIERFPAQLKGSMVSCPVCDEIIDADYINDHLDQNCELGQKDIEVSKHAKESNAQAKAWAKVLGGSLAGGNTRLKGKALRLDDVPSKRMSKVNYDTKNVKQLREMLGELGLSDKGDVAQLRIRHERFINLWNSEVDAPKPRSRNTLLREMAQWESAVSKAKPAPKVNSSETWLDNNRGQFDKLIEQARPKPKDNQSHRGGPSKDAIVLSPSSLPRT